MNLANLSKTKIFDINILLRIIISYYKKQFFLTIFKIFLLSFKSLNNDLEFIVINFIFSFYQIYFIRKKNHEILLI